MSTPYIQLKAQIAKLEKQASTLRQREQQTALRQIQTLMADYELTPEDLVPKKSRSKPTKQAATRKAITAPKVKYRDPATGKTWSGKGKAPLWIKEAQQQGKQDKFLIQSTETSTTADTASRKSPTPKRGIKARTSKGRNRRTAKVNKPVSAVGDELSAAKPQ